MDVVSLLTILAAFLGFFLWNRSEASTLASSIRSEILANRAEAKEDYRRVEGLIEAIKIEMKDFHGRLCAIEERRRVERE